MMNEINFAKIMENKIIFVVETREFKKRENSCNWLVEELGLELMTFG